MVKNQGTEQREQRTPGYCWQWKANGQCSKGDNCSFRHDINKSAKPTQPNPSPRSSTRQSERNASRTRSPRGKSPEWKNVSMALQGLPQRDLHQIHSVKSGLVSFSRFLVPQTAVPRSSQAPAVAPWAPWALCHAIGAHAESRTTAKSETKKCLMVGEGVYWLPSRVVSVRFFFGSQVKKPVSSAILLRCSTAYCSL